MTKKKESFYYEDNNTSIRINNQFMIGEHQKMNAALLIASLIFLNKFKKINLSKKFIEEGISKTKWCGRLEKINCKNNLSELWIDSCHNPSGTKAIAREMKKMNFEKQKKMNLIFSLKKGKKIRDFIIPFEGIFDEIKYIYNPRIIPRNHLVEKVLNESENGNYALLNKFIENLNDPYSNDIFSDFQRGPTEDEKVHQTFCGT